MAGSFTNGAANIRGGFLFADRFSQLVLARIDLARRRVVGIRQICLTDPLVNHPATIQRLRVAWAFRNGGRIVLDRGVVFFERDMGPTTPEIDFAVVRSSRKQRVASFDGG